MNTTLTNPLKAVTLIALGLALAAMGLYVAEADDAPGAGGMGLLLMTTSVVLAVRVARNRLPAWAARTALAVGLVLTGFAALLTQAVAAMVPLFAQAPQVPSVVGVTPPSSYSAAVERARALVQTQIREQNLPGVSVAVGVGKDIVWSEAFGWRDVDTQTPMTTDTRFNIGTAASVVAPAAPSLALKNTGAESAVAWSPEQIGEPGEDFPPFAFVRHNILQPLGLVAPEYPIAGDRATFYAPRSDDNPARGRRLMYMRDLACCANGMAFYSTPSDLVRFALAKHPASVDGSLAGGMVMSLVTRPDRELAVAVTSNITHARTASLAERIAEAFAR